MKKILFSIFRDHGYSENDIKNIFTYSYKLILSYFRINSNCRYTYQGL